MVRTVTMQHEMSSASRGIRLVDSYRPQMICYVPGGTLKLTHSLSFPGPLLLPSGWRFYIHGGCFRCSI